MMLIYSLASRGVFSLTCCLHGSLQNHHSQARS